jgi:drug/metabolite transporter (DMT)-like permease
MSLVAVGLLCAAMCALLTNVAFLLKHRGCQAAPEVTVRRPLASAVGLWRQRWFAIGMAVATAGFLFHVLAIALAPLSLGQAVIAGGLVWLAVIAERLFGLTMGRRQYAGVICTAVGLALLVLTLPKPDHAHGTFDSSVLLLMLSGLLLFAFCLLGASKLPKCRNRCGVLVGMAAGTLFAMSDIAIKAVSSAGGPLDVITSPWLAFVLTGAVIGFYTAARSLQHDDAIAVITCTSMIANLSGVAGGLLVFGDPLPSQPVAVVVALSAFGLVLLSAWLVPAPVRVRPAAA